MDIRYSFEDFEPLVERADSEIGRLRHFTNGQIIVVMTSDNDLYHVVVRELCTMCASNSDMELIDSLVEKNESFVTKLICMCADGSLSLPSFSFRKKLLAINEKNKDTDVRLCEENIFICKKLSHTF